MIKNYLIAGLKVIVFGKQTLLWISKLPGYDLFEKDRENDLEADIRVFLDYDVTRIDLGSVTVIHHFNVLDMEHVFSKYENGYVFEMYEKDNTKIVTIIYNLQTNTVFMSSCKNETVIKYATWIAYFLPAFKKNVIPIHASSIVKDSEAVLFLGESGIGKSTHTKLWLQHIEDSYLLNDDSPLLRLKDGKILVCGSPWSGKTDCYRQDMIPLKAMVRLKQNKKNKISRYNILKSIGAIHPSFPPFLAYDELFSEKIIQIIDKILNLTPVYELECLPNKEAAEIAYTSIYTKNDYQEDLKRPILFGC